MPTPTNGIAGKLTLTSIVIGERARAELGDIPSLAASIARVGLLNPIVVNTRYELIAGRRRLAAVTSLKWSDVPVRIVATFDDALLAIIAERDENTCRKELSPVEMVQLGRKIEALEKPQAQDRQEASRPKKGEKIGRKPVTAEGGGNFPPPSAKGKTRDKVATALGVSGKQYSKAKAVVEAAEKEPETFAPIVAKMEATGKVDPAYRHVVDAKTIKVTKQRIDDDMPGPVRAKLIQNLEAAKASTEHIQKAIDGLRSEKIDPQTLPALFTEIAELFDAVSANFRELASTPIEDLSSEVLFKMSRKVFSAIRNDDAHKGNVGAAMLMLRKVFAARPTRPQSA